MIYLKCRLIDYWLNNISIFISHSVLVRVRCMFSTSLSLILLPLETTIHGFNVLNFTPKIRFNVLNLEKISHLERRFGALKRHMGHPWCWYGRVQSFQEPDQLISDNCGMTEDKSIYVFQAKEQNCADK